MSDTLQRIKSLVERGDYRISEHGRRRLLRAGVSGHEVVPGVSEAVLVEDYPSFPKGPCVLVLQWDDDRLPYHALWGIPAGSERPAVLITAYRPDPSLWRDDWTQRL